MDIRGRNMGWISKEARNAYLAKWREKNRDKTRAAQQRYYAANKEKCTTAVMKTRENNPEYYSAEYFALATLRSINKDRKANLEYRREYYANNSAKEIARVRRRQGRIQHGDMLMNLGEQVEVQGMYQFCQIFKGFEVDHIIPLNGKQVSGLHVLSNLQILPVSENRSKANKFIGA